MELIDKSAIKAKIKRLKSIKLSIFSRGETEEDCYNALSCISVYNEILSLIDTLEVKEVDLEKEYDNEFFKDPVFGKLVNRNAGIGIAKHFFELGIKTKKENKLCVK